MYRRYETAKTNHFFTWNIASIYNWKYEKMNDPVSPIFNLNCIFFFQIKRVIWIEQNPRRHLGCDFKNTFFFVRHLQY